MQGLRAPWRPRTQNTPGPCIFRQFRVLFSSGSRGRPSRTAWQLFSNSCRLQKSKACLCLRRLWICSFGPTAYLRSWRGLQRDILVRPETFSQIETATCRGPSRPSIRQTLPKAREICAEGIFRTPARAAISWAGECRTPRLWRTRAADIF